MVWAAWLSRLVWLLSTLQVLAAAQQGQSAVAHLTSSHAKFWQLLDAVNVNDAALKTMHGVLLAPGDAAVDAFVQSMHMTLPQLLGNTLLVDQLTAYHFLPNVVIVKGFQSPSMPLITKTAEVHYVVRFFKDPKSHKAWLVDLQGGKVPLKKQALVFGNLTVVPVDKVLMSGGYFTSADDALRLHGQLSKAYELFKRAGGPRALIDKANGSTMFVPVDKAFVSSKDSSSLVQQDARRLMAYHITTPARQAAQLQSRSEATLLSGHQVKVQVTYSGEVRAPWSGKAVPHPHITVTDENRNSANVTLFNIWAGQGVIHGIDAILQPSAAELGSAKAAAATSSTVKPNAGSNKAARRHLQQLFSDVAGLWPAQAGFQSRRKLLQSSGPSSQFGPDWSQHNPASVLLASNTVAAAHASGMRQPATYYALPDSPGWVPMNKWSDWKVDL